MDLLREKSFDFSIRIINLYKYLTAEKKELVLSKQVLRSGTSIGASICESEYSESKMDFIHKLAIAQKEVNETIYWLDLLVAANYITSEAHRSLNTDIVELLKLITASIKTAKQRLIINH